MPTDYFRLNFKGMSISFSFVCKNMYVNILCRYFLYVFWIEFSAQLNVSKLGCHYFPSERIYPNAELQIPEKLILFRSTWQEINLQAAKPL